MGVIAMRLVLWAAAMSLLAAGVWVWAPAVSVVAAAQSVLAVWWAVVLVRAADERA